MGKHNTMQKKIPPARLLILQVFPLLVYWFSRKSSPCTSILTCTFNVFGRIFPPPRLFGPARLFGTLEYMEELKMYLDFFSFLNFNGRKFFVLRRQVNVSYLASASAAEGHSWEWLLIMKTFFAFYPWHVIFKNSFTFFKNYGLVFQRQNDFLWTSLKVDFCQKVCSGSN